MRLSPPQIAAFSPVFRRNLGVCTVNRYGTHPHKVILRPLFAASYFLNLPFPTPGGFYSCVSDVPISGDTLIVERPFDVVLSWTKPDVAVPAVVPETDPSAQVFHPWTPDEEHFFCGELTENNTESEPVLPTRKERT